MSFQVERKRDKKDCHFQSGQDKKEMGSITLKDIKLPESVILRG